MARSGQSLTADQICALAATPGAADPGPLARLRVPRPVDRYDRVRELSRGRRVLDLGAYDETEVDNEHDTSWRWLHAEIASVAAECLGVDASEKVRVKGTVRTPCDTSIVYGTVEQLDRIVEDFKPDLIVAGELVEHTQDTLGWISRLAGITPGTRFVATTPNTTSVVNLLLALLGRESCHPDHLQVYSFRTLSTLSGRAPLHDITVRPYYYDPHLFRARVPRPAVPLVAGANLALRTLQYLFPLLSCGLILEGTLGPVPADRHLVAPRSGAEEVPTGSRTH
ncbi:hypothetical protein [Kitasatospora sp. MAP5-34]|uniref:hypothetical protein n=1 Tax=Kitasatospora sp. MAP5-34 TaxID=3035102 RepID=UPI0024736C4F|nr:hypothetical protein [Kitasatospora sp. MAP5-34]MDH6576493.1 hypothetical protein [Kitasatospora sp. MAP5-34]